MRQIPIPKKRPALRGFGTSCSQLIWQAIAVCSLLLLAANNTWAEHSLELQRRWTFDASEQSLLELPPTKLAGAATGSDVATGAAVLSPAEIEALGVPSVRWTGQVQLDSVWFSQSDQSREVIAAICFTSVPPTVSGWYRTDSCG